MEFNFQKMVILVFLIILVITLIIIGLKINDNKNKDWPPYVANCPDYWVDVSANGSSCLNSHKLGVCNLPSEGNPNTKNFNVAPYTGDDGLCKKKKWANGCGVAWDGVNYGVEDPCLSTN